VTTLVYRYGLLAPTLNGEMVRTQMRSAHRYRNALTEIERNRRAVLREAQSAHGDIGALTAAAIAADAAVGDAVCALKAARSDARTKRADTPEARDVLAHARVAKSTANAALREARRAQRESGDLTALSDAVNERAAEMQRAARASCGVYWGSYLLVEAAMQAARGAPMYDGPEPNDPRFSRWDGQGAIGVQVQGGMAAADVFGDDQRIQIAIVPDRNPNRRRPRTFATLRMRVGSDEQRGPIWAEFPMVLHRPLPEDSRIKQAAVTVRRIGPREEWALTITLALDSVREASRGEGEVAVDLGWRLIGDELRVAAWHASDGQSGELRLRYADMAALTLPQSLRSTRDTGFLPALAKLRQALESLEAPQWFRDATATLAQWRSPARLAALVLRWKAARFDGDGAAFTDAEAWRYHDHHLWTWESDQRQGGLRRRREIYRVFAAMLSRRYATVVLEAFDLRKVARLPVAESQTTENETARGNRQLAAVSELRTTLINAFRGRGGSGQEVPAQDSTHECAECGHVDAFDAAEHLEHDCSGCGARWDQDANAARGLLARGERERDAQKVAGAREDGKAAEPLAIRETRWERARRLRAEKEARMGTAREAVGTGAE